MKNTPELAEESGFAVIRTARLICVTDTKRGFPFSEINLGGTTEAVFRPKRTKGIFYYLLKIKMQWTVKKVRVGTDSNCSQHCF